MIVVPFISICILLLIGKILRAYVRIFQMLYLPASVIAGVLGLISLQLLSSNGAQSFVKATTSGWSALPGFLINIVFATLFLGSSIPSIKKIWKISGPQLAYGQIVAWGQYVVGLGFVLLFLGKMFNLPDAFGLIIPVGFEGGHGTAAGLKETFEFFNWSEGTHLALASATVGVVSAIVVGMALINWAIRRGHVSRVKSYKQADQYEMSGIYQADKRPILGYRTLREESADTLAIHLAFVGLAVGIGFGLKELLLFLQQFVPVLARHDLFRGFPLFPLCMIGGLLVQLVISKSKKMNLIDSDVMKSWSGTALDFLIVSAIATIRIETILSAIVPFAIICLGGILWNVFCVMYLARRMLPDDWFERSIAEMGQSMGVTATGLLLLKAVDPKSESNAPSAFAYKQLLHEPFMGGGLWTSSAIPLIMILGSGLPVFLISLGAIFAWLVVWFLLFRKLKID